MAEPQYRYGGPIPESVQRLKKRREWRASSLYDAVKRVRREALLRNPPDGWEQERSSLGEVIAIRSSPTLRPPASFAGDGLRSPKKPDAAEG